MAQVDNTTKTYCYYNQPKVQPCVKVNIIKKLSDGFSHGAPISIWENLNKSSIN